MKRIKISVLCLFLIAALLLQGCSSILRFRSGTLMLPPDATVPTSDTSSTTEPPDSSEPTEPPDNPHTPYDAYVRAEDAPLDPISFQSLNYERPDAQALCDAFADVQKMVEDGESAAAVAEAFERVYDEYLYFNTMGQYAYIRYTLDLNDTYYDDEYNWCEEQSPKIEQALEKCCVAMAESPQRDELEKLTFGEGFFEYYDENRVFSDDRVVALMQEESALQSQYMALQSDMTVVWDGEEQLVDDLLSDEDLDYYDMIGIYEAYYDKYNPAAAQIFCELIRVRRQIAETLGYESYADFAYKFYFERDYTPAQADAYIKDIAREMAPLYYTAASNTYSEEMDTDEVMTLLRDTAYRFGGEIATAYDYMIAYDLYDITESSSKMPGSYMTYLPSYGMPFLYVSPTGTIDDFLTAAHEFGHFAEGFVNCGGTTAIDCAEIFSQGLEFLALNRADLTSRQRSRLADSKLSNAILVFLSQAAYVEFERRAYELPDDELTPESLNALFLESYENFGMAIPGLEDILAPGWIDVQHFFIAPFYVISYCVSNDVALQIYQIELEYGTGLDVYYELMRHSAGNSILSLLEEVDMESPFAEGRMEELAEFFIEQLE